MGTPSRCEKSEAPSDVPGGRIQTGGEDVGAPGDVPWESIEVGGSTRNMSLIAGTAYLPRPFLVHPLFLGLQLGPPTVLTRVPTRVVSRFPALLDAC